MKPIGHNGHTVPNGSMANLILAERAINTIKQSRERLEIAVKGIGMELLTVGPRGKFLQAGAHTYAAVEARVQMNGQHPFRLPHQDTSLQCLFGRESTGRIRVFVPNGNDIATVRYQIRLAR